MRHMLLCKYREPHEIFMFYHEFKRGNVAERAYELTPSLKYNYLSRGSTYTRLSYIWLKEQQ